jgi:hypothetical protein
MPSLTSQKIFSWFILVVLVAVTINGVHKGSHPPQEHASVTVSDASRSDLSAPHHCPCSPVDQHNDCDDCDACANCSCHAQLTSQPFQLSYNPTISSLSILDPFRHLPEVYLSKFVPPQLHA